MEISRSPRSEISRRGIRVQDSRLSRYMQFNKSRAHNPAISSGQVYKFFSSSVHASRSEPSAREPSMYKIETFRCTRQSNVMSVFRVSPREHPSRYAHHEEALEVVNTRVPSSIRAATRNAASRSIAHHHGYPDRDSRTIGDYRASGHPPDLLAGLRFSGLAAYRPILE